MTARRCCPLAASIICNAFIYMGTFSKTLFPGLRIGYAPCPND